MNTFRLRTMSLLTAFAALLTLAPLANAQATPKEAAPATEGLLTFLDYTQIGGFPLSYEKGKSLQWNAPSFLKPVSFKTSQLVNLDLPKTKEHPSLENNPDLIEITIKRSNDTFIGALESFDDDTVTLNTSYAGILKIQRDMIKKFRVLDQKKPLLDATNTPLDDSWVISPEEAWTTQNRNLLSLRAGSFGKEIKLPRYSQFSFDMEWKEFPRISMHFLGDEEFKHYYEFSFQSLYSIYFRKHGTNTQHRHNFQRIDPAKINALKSQEKMRLDIYLDRKKRVFTLFIENQLILEYSDPEILEALDVPDALENENENLKDPYGEHFRFFNSKNSPLKLPRFQVIPWTGKLPKPPRNKANLPPGFKPEGTSISLRNGDRVFGQLIGIKEKIATIKTTRGNIQLPLIFIKDLPITSGLQPNEPILRPHDIRAWFHNGGYLTFELDQLTPEKITGSSQTFGTATFDLSAFHRLDFNIHQEEVKSFNGKSGW